MFLKLLIALAILIWIAVGVGALQDKHNALSTQLRSCQRISDNNGYIGFKCGIQTRYVPKDDEGQLR